MAALKIVRDGHLLRVTLAKPERRNAFDAALIAELSEAFADVGDARAVLLAGEGPSFCAGADVEWQRASIDLSYDENVEDAMRLYRMLEAIDSCPAPVVCCVHGFALGGGSGLVACADIAITWPDAVFGFTEVRLGIIPAVISPFVLAKIGSAARRYFVTGERFDAEVALRIGLVSEVAEDAGERAEAIVGDILAGGPIATREAKRLVLDGPAGEETARIAATRRTSDEGQDGLRAFLERRPPGWLED
jgi:methylglutaconyl-CoA hydratase